MQHFNLDQILFRKRLEKRNKNLLLNLAIYINFHYELFISSNCILNFDVCYNHYLKLVKVFGLKFASGSILSIEQT